MGGRAVKRYLFCVVGTLALVAVFYHLQSPCFTMQSQAVMVSHPQYLLGNDAKKYKYDRNMPLIFIGGMPRSGTTLLRVLLDAHPDIRCGEETRVIPRLLSIRQQWLKAPIESKRLQEAGISGPVLDSAVAAFILEIIARHGEPAPRLCNKDPFTLRSAVYLNSLFPSSKFIFMIRDGRAVVHSIITRKVTISGFDLTDYRQCMKKWNAAMQSMHVQCQQLGSDVCLPVYYEQLVLHPHKWMERILQFLEVPWNDTVLHHEQFINRPGGISLSKLERSTDQVIKPINIEALSKWVGQIPEDVVKDMANVAPMLSVLGYDPHANPPNYGKPDSFVMRNTKQIAENRDVWVAKEMEMIRERESIRSSLLRQHLAKNGSNGKTMDHNKVQKATEKKSAAGDMQLENPVSRKHSRKLLGMPHYETSPRTLWWRRGQGTGS